ncbi:hypothetical protein [Komagataeibacter sp. FNDCR2]|uniref:hypothetical protein n=1 Tax=Komagataeibacter sp. FNDCR2 TaxID=2878682 RepID=UPI001E4CEEE1|nr:hypothetical protein [Komagataeibacter sp. FNDCR2]MCE2574262.1 hypothetical protein [Komagataeibacter sp. FNDCR2]
MRSPVRTLFGNKQSIKNNKSFWMLSFFKKAAFPAFMHTGSEVVGAGVRAYPAEKAASAPKADNPVGMAGWAGVGAAVRRCGWKVSTWRFSLL